MGNSNIEIGFHEQAKLSCCSFAPPAGRWDAGRGAFLGELGPEPSSTYLGPAGGPARPARSESKPSENLPAASRGVFSNVIDDPGNSQHQPQRQLLKPASQPDISFTSQTTGSPPTSSIVARLHLGSGSPTSNSSCLAKKLQDLVSISLSAGASLGNPHRGFPAIP